MSMKRILVVSLLITNLVGCSSNKATPRAIKDKDIPGDITIEVNKPELNIETNIVEEKFYTASGKSYVELDLRLPVLSGDYLGINEINNYYDEKYLMFYHGLNINLIEEIEASILANPASETQTNGEYVISGRLDNYWQMGHYEMTSQFGKFISFKGDLNGGQGGVSWLGLEGDVFNLETGQRLLLEDVFTVAPEVYDELIYSCIDEIMTHQIENESKDVNHYPDVLVADEEIKKQLILKYDRNNFYFNSNGIVISYQKYTLGPGASGVISFTIPFDKIQNILYPQILDSIDNQ